MPPMPGLRRSPRQTARWCSRSRPLLHQRHPADRTDPRLRQFLVILSAPARRADIDLGLTGRRHRIRRQPRPRDPQSTDDPQGQHRKPQEVSPIRITHGSLPARRTRPRSGGQCREGPGATRPVTGAFTSPAKPMASTHRRSRWHFPFAPLWEKAHLIGLRRKSRITQRSREGRMARAQDIDHMTFRQCLNPVARPGGITNIHPRHKLTNPASHRVTQPGKRMRS